MDMAMNWIRCQAVTVKLSLTGNFLNFDALSYFTPLDPKHSGSFELEFVPKEPDKGHFGKLDI